MKMQLWLILGCWCFWVAPLVGNAEPASEFIEQFSSGCINWTQGVVTATGMGPIFDFGNPPEQIRKIEPISLDASHNLLQTLENLRMSHDTHLCDLLDAQKKIRFKIEEMTSAAKLVETTPIPGGSMAVTIEMSLFGGFAQLMLPSEIRQVEAIKPLNGNRTVNHQGYPVRTVGNQNGGTKPDVYTGLLVDARGVGAAPAMVPVLLDENGQAVYGPAYVSREYAVQNGMCRYIKGIDNKLSLPRIAPNPLRVKGLRTVAKGSCDIVISNTDASKIRGASSHLEFLKQCRVVIILD